MCMCHSRAEVPQLDGEVGGGGREEGACLVEGHALHGVGVALERRLEVTSLHVPRLPSAWSAIGRLETNITLRMFAR